MVGLAGSWGDSNKPRYNSESQACHFPNSLAPGGIISVSGLNPIRPHGVPLLFLYIGTFSFLVQLSLVHLNGTELYYQAQPMNKSGAVFGKDTDLVF